jgi:hypothetical protein
LDGESSAHRPLGVVLLHLRVAEEHHQPVPQLLQHVTAEACYGRGGLFEIGIDEIPPILGVKPRREVCRSDEIAKHQRDRTTFRVPASGKGRWGGSRGRVGFGWRSAFLRRGTRLSLGEAGDRSQKPLAIAERHADLHELAIRQIGQHVHIDHMFAEDCLVPLETETAKPLADAHSRAAHPS